jgi:acyl dehydratase
MKVGDILTLRKGPLTTRQIVMYAGASGDFNPIHYDRDIAEVAGLGGVIAHGMLTLGFGAQLIGDWLAAQGWVKQINARFLAPVRPGDIVELTAQVVEVFGEADCDRSVRAEINAKVDDRPVLRGYAVFIQRKELSPGVGDAQV